MTASFTTPTPATNAPPPPRGEGMGVGGRLRDARHLAILLVTLLLTSPTAAQIIPTGTPAADILLSRAIAEHRTFLTCSALELGTHNQILSNWQYEVTAAVTVLTANTVPPEAIAAFQAAAEPAALMPAEGAAFADVRALCDSNPDWLRAYFDLDRVFLDLTLPQAFP